MLFIFVDRKKVKVVGLCSLFLELLLPGLIFAYIKAPVLSQLHKWSPFSFLWKLNKRPLLNLFNRCWYFTWTGTHFYTSLVRKTFSQKGGTSVNILTLSMWSIIMLGAFGPLPSIVHVGEQILGHVRHFNSHERSFNARNLELSCIISTLHIVMSDCQTYFANTDNLIFSYNRPSCVSVSQECAYMRVDNAGLWITLVAFRSEWNLRW
jgi:hypothetical protein